MSVRFIRSTILHSMSTSFQINEKILRDNWHVIFFFYSCSLELRSLTTIFKTMSSTKSLGYQCFAHMVKND